MKIMKPDRLRIFITGLFCLGICLFNGFSPLALGAENRAFVPSEGHLLIIGQQKGAMEDYVETFQTVPAGFMVYTSIQEVDGLDRPSDKGAGVQHARHWVEKYPGTVLQIGLYMVGTLSDILDGVYDRNIDQLGDWIEEAACPVYLRIGYEFDNPENRYDPDLYQAAFRYIVKAFRKKGIPNVCFVWHSGAFSDQPEAFLNWYPGDEYVDWFGFSFFVTRQRGVIKTFCELARRHHKPLMIAESAPAGLYTSRAKVEWFKHFFNLIEEEDVRCVSYIHAHWDQLPMFEHMKWGDSRIQSDREIAQLWMSRIQDSVFLQHSPQLYSLLEFSSPE